MLLFLPGLICDARTFAAQLDAFPGTHAVDSYGHGRQLSRRWRESRWPMPMRWGRSGSTCSAIRWAGAWRSRCSAWRPKRVRRLALVSTGIHPLGANEPAKRAALQQVGHDNGFETLVDHWLPPMVAEANQARDELYAPMRSMCLDAGQERFDAQIAALVGRPPKSTSCSTGSPAPRW